MFVLIEHGFLARILYNFFSVLIFLFSSFVSHIVFECFLSRCSISLVGVRHGDRFDCCLEGERRPEAVLEALRYSWIESWGFRIPSAHAHAHTNTLLYVGNLETAVFTGEMLVDFILQD